MASAKPAKHQKWEYKVYWLDAENSAEEDATEMNKLGRDGWELVNTRSLSDGNFLQYYKRPVIE